MKTFLSVAAGAFYSGAYIAPWPWWPVHLILSAALVVAFRSLP